LVLVGPGLMSASRHDRVGRSVRREQLDARRGVEALNSIVSPSAPQKNGCDQRVPGKMSATSPVVAAAPALDHSSGPVATVSLTNTTRPAIAVRSVGASSGVPGFSADTSVVLAEVPVLRHRE
jgi:hypothetical protein